MAKKQYAYYEFDTQKKNIEKGTLIFDPDLSTYTKNENLPNINIGEIDANSIYFLLKDDSLAEHPFSLNPFFTIRNPKGWTSGLISGVKTLINVEGNSTKSVYIDLDKIGYTKIGGLHAIGLGFLGNGSFITYDAVTYTVDDGVNNYENTSADVYEEIYSSIENTFIAYADRVIQAETDILNHEGRIADIETTEIPRIDSDIEDLQTEKVDRAGDKMSGDLDLDNHNLENVAVLELKSGTTLAPISFDGTDLIVNIGGTNFKVPFKNRDNVFTNNNALAGNVVIGGNLTAQKDAYFSNKNIKALAAGIDPTDAVNLEQLNTSVETHDDDAFAHESLRMLIEALEQEITRLDGKGKSWGMIDKTQSELLAMAWVGRTNYINDYLANKYIGYTPKTGDLIYTKTVVGENEHEWEYNHDAGDWMDNGAWTVEKASNNEYGLIKGNAYLSIVSGLVQVLKSDFAGGLGTSETYLNYAQVKAAIDELDNIYRKTAVYNKTEIDALFNQLKSIYGWKDTFIGTYNNNGGSNIILGTAIADYDYIYVEIYDLSALGETFVYYGKLKDIEGETAIGNYVITKLDGNYTITGFGSNDYANVYGVKMIKTDADKIAYDNTTSELDAENLQEAIDELVVNKVDKVTGYGLSKNDYTDNEKLKVSKLVIDGAGTKALYDDGTYKTVSADGGDLLVIDLGDFTNWVEPKIIDLGGFL